MTTSLTLTEKIAVALQFIRLETLVMPKTGLILGTALGSIAQSVKVLAEIPFSQIPHFAASTTDGHAGQLVFGEFEGQSICIMQGRLHFYEGYSLEEITFPVRVMQGLGIETLIVTNIAGGLNPQFKTGDLVVITDHINLMGVNPLIGIHHESLGPRFVDMSEPYSRALIELAVSCAIELKQTLHRGVYSAMTGPSLETAAEYRMLRILGADTIGMSTVPEVIVAVQAGIKVLGLSLVSDLCLPDALRPINLPELFAVVAQGEPKLTALVKAVLTRLPS